MSAPTAPYDHRAFGLTIRSCLPLPVLPGEADATPDVEIVYADVPSELPGALARGVRFQVAKNRLLLQVDRIARYLAEDGCRVKIAREREATDDEVRLFLLGPVLGALLHQRGDLVLHGSVVGFDGEAVALLGTVGSGKSALAAALGRAGCDFLSDDQCVVRMNPSGVLYAVTGLPLLKLWPDILQQLGLAPDAVERVRAGVNKRVLRMDQGSVASLPLKTVIVLNPTNRGDVVFEPVGGTRRFNVLRGHVYRPRFRAAGEEAQFTSLVKLAQQAEMTILTRPRATLRLRELALRVIEGLSV